MQREIEEEILEEDEESLDLGETPPHTVEENAPSITNAASATSTKPSQS
jgi:hypothetical protein